MTTTLTTFIIPLVNEPQSFTMTLAGTVYTLTVKWNDMGGYWILNIADSNDVALVSNIPLITGADLLDGLAYLGIGGSLFVSTNGSSSDAIPTLDNLGVDSNLYFQTDITS